MNDRELMQMALNALEHGLPIIEDFGGKEQLQLQHKAIAVLYEALRAALAQPEPEELGEVIPADEEQLKRIAKLIEPEPVAWRVIDGEGRINYVSRHKDSAESWLQYDATRRLEPLYTATPQREWAKQIKGVRVDGCNVVVFAGNNDAARDLCGALLEEKNHG